MKFIKFLPILILASCSLPEEHETDAISTGDTIPQKSISVNDTIHEKQDCIIGEEQLDGTRWQDGFINPEKVYPGYEIMSAHIGSSDNDYGIITLLNQSDSLVTLFFVKSTANSVNAKILGSKKLGKLLPDQTILSLCADDCNLTTTVTGWVTVNDENQTATIKAWGIDEEKGKIIILNPSSINCTDAYNTDYD